MVQGTSKKANPSPYYILQTANNQTITDQEIIEEFNKGKNPAFSKKLDELFRKPVIVISLPATQSNEGKDQPKPDLSSNQETQEDQ